MEEEKTSDTDMKSQACRKDIDKRTKMKKLIRERTKREMTTGGCDGGMNGKQTAPPNINQSMQNQADPMNAAQP